MLLKPMKNHSDPTSLSSIQKFEFFKIFVFFHPCHRLCLCSTLLVFYNHLHLPWTICDNPIFRGCLSNNKINGHETLL